MSQHDGLNRRSFLRNAGMTALAGAVASGTSLGAAASSGAAASGLAPDGKFDFDTVYNRFGTNSVKYDQQIRIHGKDSIQVGMGIADLDFRVAPSITAALQERLKHENWGYLDGVAFSAEMAKQVVAWNKRRHGLTIDPATIVFATGVHPGLISTLQTYSPPASKVALLTPTYNGFYGDLTASRTIAEESVMKLVNGRYTIDFDDFEKRVAQPDVHTFLLCNPQNPTGNVWRAEELLRLGEICLKHQVIVLSDEIHCDFVTKGVKFTPFASLPNKAVVDNSLTYQAVSKTFGLAAHKYAWFFSTNTVMLERVKKNLRSDISTLGAVANMGALTGGEEWLNQVLDYIDGSHELAVDYITKNIPMIKAVKPQGTYLLWLDCTALAEKIGARKQAADFNAKRAFGVAEMKPESVLEKWFVQNARVQMNAGHTYGKGGENHMRMNVGTSRKLIQLALDNIANATKNPVATAML